MVLASTQTLAELAVTHPAASRVFHKYGLDFCCKGNRSLELACIPLQVSAEEMLAEISATTEPLRDWENLPIAELIDHVLSTYHQPALTELPELLELAKRVETRHRAHPAVPAGLHELLQTWFRDLLSHMKKEELVLFPLFLSGGGPNGQAPVGVMEAEHESHGRALQRVRVLTNDLTPPEEACTSWRALYLRLQQFEFELMNHIAFEQEVLFPRGLQGGL